VFVSRWGCSGRPPESGNYLSGSNLEPKDSIKKGGCFTKQWDQGLWVNSHILKPPAFGGVARNWKASLPTAAVDA
jgi:hypothetical protein